MESWPRTAEAFALSLSDVKRNIAAVRELLAKHALDALVVTSNDRYLNEYTPLADNQRYWLSGFNGSTALMLVPREGRVKLFVDGRYHLQADMQVDAEDVQVVKASLSTMLSAALNDEIRGKNRVGYDPERVTKSMEESICGLVKEAVPLPEGELDRMLGQDGFRPSKPIRFVDPKIFNRTTAEKLAAVFASIAAPDETVILACALDDIAWLTDGRGYHYEYQSSYAARALVTKKGVHVALDPGVMAHGVAGAPADVSFTDMPFEALARSAAFDGVKTVLYDAHSTSAFVVQALKRARPEWKFTAQSSAVAAAKALKTPAEIRYLEAINDRSSRAIAKTIRFVRKELSAGRRVSEITFYEAANSFYAAEGAIDLSFHTIAAIGKDSAIIHFSEPKVDVVCGPNDLMLLDSGALYEGGIATDVTRTFLAGGRRGRPDPKAVEIYTLVTKGLLNAMNAIFPEGTRGAFLDAMARQPIYMGGYDYGHGTGHGVGIHVHEPGVSLGPTSQLAIRANHVSSIEPGIYLPEFGGVRLENVVVYEPHPTIKGFLRSRPFNYVGLDECLIDRKRLSADEAQALDAYQAECRRRGTDIMDD